jgi:hypothetical protein
MISGFRFFAPVFQPLQNSMRIIGMTSSSPVTSVALRDPDETVIIRQWRRKWIDTSPDIS